MGKHVHDADQDDKIERWGIERMTRHLRDVHHLTPPMSWDTGRLHQAHLEDHQKGMKRPEPTPEFFAPVQPSGECGAYYGVGDGTSAVCRRPANHPPVSADGIGHSSRPIPIQPKAEEAPMTQIPPMTTPTEKAAARAQAAFVQMTRETGETTLDDEAKALMLAKFPGRDWDTIAPETQAYWRTQVKLRPHQPAERTGERPGHLDRFIAAMAGLDFDTQWAADSGIGSSARGLLREQYGKAAERLLFRLERGGLMPFGPLTEVEQEALDGLRAERDAALSDSRHFAARASTLQQQMQEQQRAMQEMVQDRELAESLNRELEEANNRLRGNIVALERSLKAREQETERVRQQFQSVIAERDRVRDARVEVENELAEVQEERDRAQERLMEKLTEADELRQRLDMTQTASRNLQDQVHDLKDELERVTERLVTEAGTLREQLAVTGRQLEETKAERDEHVRLHRAAVARRDEALERLGEVAGERNEWRREAQRTAAQLAVRTRGLERGRYQLINWITELQQLRPDPSYHEVQASEIIRVVESILRGPVSTAKPIRLAGPETGDVPVTPEEPKLIRGDASGIRHITLEEARIEDEGEDDLSWARRFAAGDGV